MKHINSAASGEMDYQSTTVNSANPVNNAQRIHILMAFWNTLSLTRTSVFLVLLRAAPGPGLCCEGGLVIHGGGGGLAADWLMQGSGSGELSGLSPLEAGPGPCCRSVTSSPWLWRLGLRALWAPLAGRDYKGGKHIVINRRGSDRPSSRGVTIRVFVP